MHRSLLRFCEMLASGAPLRAVFFGDSITFGSQVDPHFDHSIVYHRQWHDALKKRFPRMQLEVVNRGVPGNKIADAHKRAGDVIAEQPDLVVVEFGINDCWDGLGRVAEFESELGRLVERLREGGVAAVVLMTANMMNHRVTPEALSRAWFAEKSCEAQTSGWMGAYMEAVRRVASRLDVPLADGYAKWQSARAKGVDTDLLLANGANHPDGEGHALLAEALIATVGGDAGVARAGVVV